MLSNYINLTIIVMRKVNLLDPWQVTGLTDGDGSFYVTISKSVKNEIGWSVSINFQIVASENSANVQMLELVKSFFCNIGNISRHGSDNTIRYTVGGVSNCKIIQTHFVNYPLLTYKLVYFHLWSTVLDIMGKGEHLTSVTKNNWY
uniref:LAGLIDADG endonuclease n=1 Tax=Ganoderma leucocontextum TaxID=1566825 RepID=A0A2S1WBK4_9APHY|nr:LAGLIDADG endonuclease [Ganoderma leucocontextum]AWJ63951.1 LAGLIDADG endonuclease [Ganoderma leucocontextum]